MFGHGFLREKWAPSFHDFLPYYIAFVDNSVAEFWEIILPTGNHHNAKSGLTTNKIFDEQPARIEAFLEKSREKQTDGLLSEQFYAEEIADKLRARVHTKNRPLAWSKLVSRKTARTKVSSMFMIPFRCLLHFGAANTVN